MSKLLHLATITLPFNKSAYFSIADHTMELESDPLATSKDVDKKFEKSSVSDKYSNDISALMMGLWQDQEFTDVRIKTSESDATIFCHSALLSLARYGR